MSIWTHGVLLVIGFAVATEACGGTFTALSGVFTTPDYPNTYPNNQRCVYTFNTGYPISITCQVFRLQPINSKGVCSRDFMQINDNGVLTRYCGTAGPQDHITTSSDVKILFKSNKRITKKGFSCTYDSITDGVTTTTTTTPTTTTTSTTTTTTTTTTATTAATAPLLSSALELYQSGTCYSTERSNCGCSASSLTSEYYTAISGNYRIVAANGIPNHVFEEGQEVPNPNKACSHEVFMAVPTNPTKGSTYNTYGMGPVGIATSGAFFYNHLSNPMGAVAVINEGQSFDTCHGHSDPNCRYHYHMVPTCIAGEGTCSFVGYMRDGFPVYTYCTHETESRYLKSCYSLVSGDGSMASHYTYNTTAYTNGDCDLDQANGYTFSDERGYAYIFTEDYPFIMAGYYGTELSSVCYLTSS